MEAKTIIQISSDNLDELVERILTRTRQQAPKKKTEVSPTEYAAKHGLAVVTVMNHLRNGTLPAENYKIGKFWRIIIEE